MTADTQDDIAAMLRESARDFTAREQDLRGLRVRMGHMPGYDEARFAQMQQLGWRSALVREEFGGAGMGLREMAAIAGELGRGLLGDVLLATSVLPVLLLQDRTALPPAASLLRGIAEGSVVSALAWQEDPVRLEPELVATRAVRVAGGYELTGVKRWVAGAQAASVLLISAQLDDGIAVFVVGRSAPGLTERNCWQIDGSLALEIQLERALAGADALLLAHADGAGAITRALDGAMVAAGAELLGVAGAAFDMTIAYMKTRVQYDKPIGSFQALQHKAVDLLVQRELAASVLEEAVAAFDSPTGSYADRSRLGSRCKARCSDAALRITRECIQLHGAIGYTHEYDLGLYVKRALVLSAWLGNAGQHRSRHAALEKQYKGDPA